MLWTRVAQSLKPDVNEVNMDSEQATIRQTTPPTSRVGGEQYESSLVDWTFISPSGYLSLLQLASRMLTVSTQNCAALVLKDDSLMFDTLSCMLSERFLISVKKR